MKKVLLPVALSLVACSPEGRSWPDHLRPVRLFVSDAVDEECQDSLRAAVDFWADHGAHYLIYPLEVESWQPVVAGMQPRGTIGVRAWTFPANDGSSGETLRYHIGDDIMSVQIRMRDGRCDLETAAHELGHALGLDHAPDLGNVMYPYTVPGGLYVTPDQEQQIR